MLLVYCEHITPRIAYIFQFVLDTLCGLDYEATTDETAYRSYVGATLNYSFKHLREGDVEIKPNGFLFFKAIVTCEATIRQDKEDVQLFLKAAGVDASVFDPFAAAFYLLTRYEEYLAFTPDAYNRFEATSSILFHSHLLHRPLINEWAEKLMQTFSKAHIRLPSKKKEFTCVVTIDVDQAFAFRHRGVLKNSLAFTKNLLYFHTNFLQSQWKTFLNTKPDPYDTFVYLRDVQQAAGLPFVYFINAGRATKFDKNLAIENKHFKKLLNTIKEHATIGVHPSYFADIVPEKTKKEKEALEHAVHQPVTKSRQHYLKLYFPQTYRRLLEAGLTEDYTMGYASQPGFRAGTCTPFRWFDLEKNMVTPLTVFPITYMEGTFAEDLALAPQAALEEMKKLIDTVRFYKGCCISIWHNHSVNDRFFWSGWKAVFEESVHYSINK